MAARQFILIDGFSGLRLLLPLDPRRLSGLFSPHEGSTHKGTNIFGPRYFDGALPLDLPDFLDSISLLIVYMDPTSAISNPLCKGAMKFAWIDDTTEG